MAGAVAFRNVLRPVARNRQAEEQDESKRRPLRPRGGRVRTGRPRGRRPRGASGEPSQAARVGTPQQHRAKQCHDDIQRLTGAEREAVRGVVAEEIDEEAKERVPEDKARRGRAGRRVGSPDPHQKRHQQEVLRRVVQHDGMAHACGVGKLHAPPHVGHAADNLPVDEVAESSEPHQQRTGNDEFVGQLEEGLVIGVRENQEAERRAKQKAVRRHPAKPVGGHEPGVLAIEGPLVEEDFNRTTTEEDTNHNKQAERIDLLARQRQACATPGQKPVNLEETERVTQAVPPEA